MKGIVRVSVLHMSLAIIPGIVLLFVISDLRVMRRNMLFLCAAVLSGCTLVVPTAVVGAAAYRTVHSNSSWIVSGEAWAESTYGTCRPLPDFEHMSCYLISNASIAAIEFLRARTVENEPIFVGVGRHDRIWANNVAFYFAAKRTPATKWYHFDPGLQTSEKIQREMIAELDGVRPRYAVLDLSYEVFEPNESSLSSGVLLLDRYLASRYTAIAKSGPIIVLKRLE
jgi:hypothetical protein